MLQKLFITCLAILFCLVPLVGCDQNGSGQSAASSSNQAGCGQGGSDASASSTTNTEFKFELPPTSASDVVVKYKVELKDAVTAEVIATKEGLPGQTLVFVLADPGNRVKAEISSFDRANVMVDVTETVLVNVSAGKRCKVITNVGVDKETGETTVKVNVACNGQEIVDVDVDTSETPGKIVDVDLFGRDNQ